MFGWFKAAQRLNELESVVAKLWKQMEERDLDWEEMHVRCKRLMTRAEKAARDGEGVQSSQAVEEPIPEPNGQHSIPGGRLLTPRQMQIQQQILRKRAGL